MLAGDFPEVRSFLFNQAGTHRGIEHLHRGHAVLFKTGGLVAPPFAPFVGLEEGSGSHGWTDWSLSRASLRVDGIF